MKYKRLILIIVVFLFAAITLSPLYLSENKEHVGEIWDGLRPQHRVVENEYIAIPGFSDLYMRADYNSQNVNIYNPKENKCSMNIEMLLDDGTLLWCVCNLMPGYGFHDINLLSTLDRGVYDATLRIKCFSINTGAEINGCSFSFKIIAE